MIPSRDPDEHGISKGLKPRVDMSKFLLSESCNLKITVSCRCKIFGEDKRLEEWDQLLLPKQTFVFFLQV